MSTTRSSRKRRRRRAPGAAPKAPREALAASGSEPSSVRSPEAPPPRSAAALTAFLLCLWGQSLLLFDWARRSLFESPGSGHLVLVAPVFAGAAAAGLAAWLLRARGRSPVGGAAVHGLGLASGLLGLTAVVLLLWLGPRVRDGSAESRRHTARRQLDGVAGALDLHSRAHGTFPVGYGVETLAAALAPEFLAESFPLRDPWGASLHYQSLGGGAGYLLLSSGPDGVQDLTDDEYLTEQTSRRASNDLVLITGRYVAGGPSGPPR